MSTPVCFSISLNQRNKERKKKGGWEERQARLRAVIPLLCSESFPSISQSWNVSGGPPAPCCPRTALLCRSSFSSLKWILGLRLARLGNCLPCKHDVLSLSPKKQTVNPACNGSTGKQEDRQIIWDSLASQPSQFGIFKFQAGEITKHKMDSF